jgi:Uma2 family endonuclease
MVAKTPNATAPTVTVFAEGRQVTVPPWVTDLDAFLRWRQSDGVPEKLRAWFHKGEVWLDVSMERLDTHGDLKTEITTVLRTLVKAARLGRVWGDGILIVNREADLSGEPDTVYVSNDGMTSGRVKRVQGKEAGHVALEGAPDVVLGVVSDSSEKKDNQTLFEASFAAGIPEYWLVDARGKEVEFAIYKRGAKKYTKVREQDGWVKSAVFGRSFRLVRGTDPQGNPEFTLEVR